MNNWSGRRKKIIFLIVFLALLVFIAVPGFFLFYKSPTCFDGKMNGDETGVDCGGSCQLLCTAESLPIISSGDPRVIVVATSTTQGVYEVVALFENPNPTAEARDVGYTIRLYGPLTASVPVKTVEGKTFVPKGSEFAIFEGPFSIEGDIPERAVFEWKEETIVWQRNIKPEPELIVESEVISGEGTQPRLSATLRNSSLERVSNIELVALVTDERGNVFAASRTYIDFLRPGESEPVVFSWPKPFSIGAAGSEIIPRIFPDRSFIR